MSESSRKAFEDALTAKYPKGTAEESTFEVIIDDPKMQWQEIGDYRQLWTQAAWEGWNLHRSSLPVENIKTAVWMLEVEGGDRFKDEITQLRALIGESK